jgi:hypothetical protein
MTVMDDLEPIARLYLQFADREARGSSPSYDAWSRAVAADDGLLARLATLPGPKRQPNLVFAALRWHGGRPGDADSLREGLLHDWDEVSATILRRSTQTNEPARCAVLLPLLHQIGGPIALIELGASAGLCLIPDRYGYAYSDGTVVHPADGPSDLVLECRVAVGGLPPGLAAPRIVWRAGVDLNPLDPADPDTAAWLTTLVWPEHDHRRRRLAAALRLAATEAVRIERGDLRDRLGPLVAEAPAGATPVVFHSAALAYLTGDDRAAAVAAITGSGARWISFEGRGVIELDGGVPERETLDTSFVAALDQVPVAVASAHGDAMTLLGPRQAGADRERSAPARLAREPGPDLLCGRDQILERGLGLGVAAGLQAAVGVGPQPGRADDADGQAERLGHLGHVGDPGGVDVPHARTDAAGVAGCGQVGDELHARPRRLDRGDVRV